MPQMTRDQMADELLYAAEEEGTEIGEWWSAFARLARFVDYGPAGFAPVYDEWLRQEWEAFKRDWRFVEEQVTIPALTRTEKVLRHVSELDTEADSG